MSENKRNNQNPRGID